MHKRVCFELYIYDHQTIIWNQLGCPKLLTLSEIVIVLELSLILILVGKTTCDSKGSIIIACNLKGLIVNKLYSASIKAKASTSFNKSKKRGGKRVKKQREAWKGRCSLIRVGTLNIGTMTGRGRELADMMERRNVDILCLQETRWKGSKAKNIGGGCKIFYNGADGRKNGIGIVLREELAESVLEVKRVSDRLMAMKLEVNGSILNIVRAYAPQVNNSMEEKNDFWEDLDGLIESISKEERIVLRADLNGHVGEGNIGDEEIMGRYGAGTRNKEGSMVVDFGKRMDLAIVNTYFKKKDEHRVTYKSGGKSTQVDYVMCRRRNLKEMCDCKVN